MQKSMEHSTSLPNVPVLWVRIMAWRQASGNDKRRASDLSASPKKTANTPQLAGPESADDFIGWALLKVPRHHFKFIVQGQKLLRVTTQKQLVAETLQKTTQKWPWWWLHPVQAGRTLWPCFLPFIQPLTWKWRWHDGRKRRRMDRWQRTTEGRGNSQERNIGQRKRVVTKVNELKGSWELRQVWPQLEEMLHMIHE